MQTKDQQLRYIRGKLPGEEFCVTGRSGIPSSLLHVLPPRLHKPHCQTPVATALPSSSPGMRGAGWT